MHRSAEIKNAISLLENLDRNLILESSFKNIKSWLEGNFLEDWAIESLAELLQNKNYSELNDRFFKTLEFGTGGMRGRTIAKQITKAELGNHANSISPDHPAIGANNVNDYTIAKATLGLFNYTKTISTSPKLVIAHDGRHFSRYFCEISAKLWNFLGGKAQIFESARPTPELSFAVIEKKSDVGIVITASHNAAHDNGFKVYFSDGGQIVSPNAENIIAAVNAVSLADCADALFKSKDIVLEIIPKSFDEVYISTFSDNILQHQILKNSGLKVVFSPLHGTGGAILPEAMKKFGITPILVDPQMELDPRFPTVSAPNPENPDALKTALELAQKLDADCLIATDSDADRMGAAYKTKDGKYALLNGNTIGSVLAQYRLEQMQKQGLIKKPKNCVLIKTFVTSPLQDAIAKHFKIKCVNTLTGFKWIGAKLTEYERIFKEKNPKLDCSKLTYTQRAELMQESSSFFIFGGEESYGYLGTDKVRDKDANSSALMFIEVLAYLKSKWQNLDDYLLEIYLKYGYYFEELKSLEAEGASGLAHVAAFLKSLSEKPLDSVCGAKVESFLDFSKDEIFDEDGAKIPKEKFFFYRLKNGYSFAVRASGTEPKIKFYAFAKEELKEKSELENVKIKAKTEISKLLDALSALFKSFAD